MAVGFDNLVYEFSTTTGTGNFTLSPMDNDSPAQSFRNFSNTFGTGSTNTFYYAIRNRSSDEFEVGIGYMSTSTALVRSTVLQSSNSNNAVNFSTGTKDVICDIPAAYQLDLKRVSTFKSISADYPMTASDYKVLVSSGSPTITLLAAASYIGPDIIIKNGGAGTVTLKAQVGENIDGSNSLTLTQQYQAVSINTDGTQWWLW